MDNFIVEFVATIMGLFFVIVFIIILAFGMKACDEDKWNNGYCQCGGNWEYEQAVGHYSSTTYMYICDKCGKRYEFNNVRSKN